MSWRHHVKVTAQGDSNLAETLQVEQDIKGMLVTKQENQKSHWGFGKHAIE